MKSETYWQWMANVSYVTAMGLGAGVYGKTISPEFGHLANDLLSYSAIFGTNSWAIVTNLYAWTYSTDQQQQQLPTSDSSQETIDDKLAP